ncbi:MAG: hypothetical protein QGH60_22830 [Phycisphaerae bacterium]|jgi:uncharacterized protein YwgA|nr:hypothetical protein [Phycisphaerae bacterium]
MGRRQIALKLVMDHLGLPVQLDSFGDRLILQKAIYCAQAAGVNLGYFYQWYLRGPYCPAVAEDGFAVSDESAQGINESESWTLDDSSVAKLDRIRDLLVEDRDALATKLELLASVHFLIDHGQVSTFRTVCGAWTSHVCTERMLKPRQVKPLRPRP